MFSNPRNKILAVIKQFWQSSLRKSKLSSTKHSHSQSPRLSALSQQNLMATRAPVNRKRVVCWARPIKSTTKIKVIAVWFPRSMFRRVKTSSNPQKMISCRAWMLYRRRSIPKGVSSPRLRKNRNLLNRRLKRLRHGKRNAQQRLTI